MRYAIDHKALVDTCWAGHGKLIGSMVPPTDPWYEDLTGMYPHDVAKAKALLRVPARPADTLGCDSTLPYATSCGQVVKSQLEQAGFKVTLDQLEFPAAWLTTVFKNADYDMSMVARTSNPVTWERCSTRVLHPLQRDPTFAKDIAAADQGSEQEQVAGHEEGGTTAVGQRRRRLAVPAAQPVVGGEGHHRPADQRHLRVVRPVEPGPVLSALPR